MTRILRTLVVAGALLLPLAPDAGAQQTISLHFWRSLGDTTLERLVADALNRNHDLAAASARAQGARAARLRSALDLAPTITSSAGYTRQRIAVAPQAGGAFTSLPDQDVWDAGLRLSWEVDVFGRARRSLQGHGEMVGAAEEDVQGVQVILASEVAYAYFDLLGAQDRLAVATRNAENLRGALEITLQRLEGGRGTALDTERAQAQLSATLADVPAIEAQIAGARNRLAVLTVAGQSALETLVAGRRTVTLPESLNVTNVRSAVLRRPDVRSAERQVAAGEAFVGAARAEYLPRVAFVGAAGYTGATFGSLGDGTTPRYAFGPMISWPAFDLGRVRAGVEVARAQEKESRARFEQLVLRASEQVETAVAAYHGAVRRLGHLEEAAAASERAAEIARLRFVEGASDFLQVLDAERTLLQAQERRAAGLESARSALVDVYRALGGALPGADRGDDAQ